MIPIVVFYHCLFRIDGQPLPSAEGIVREQMMMLKTSGLEDAATEIYVGVNGLPMRDVAGEVTFPPKAKVTYHGEQCRTELRTLLMIEDWCRSRKGEAHILSLHSKGATHAPDSSYGITMSSPWRNRMMRICVKQWRMCVKHLETYEAVGCHWLTGQGWDHSQHYFAGNFFWVRASFFRTIPSVTTRERIRLHGPDAVDSRYEAEVHIGNGPRLPKVKNYYDGAIGT
jgi:hypothetical protein